MLGTTVAEGLPSTCARCAAPAPGLEDQSFQCETVQPLGKQRQRPANGDQATRGVIKVATLDDDNHAIVVISQGLVRDENWRARKGIGRILAIGSKVIKGAFHTPAQTRVPLNRPSLY